MERCLDSGCGYENRLEYCVQEAKDPAGDAAVVLEFLDSLIDDNNDVTCELRIGRADAKMLVSRCDFTVLSSNLTTPSWPITENYLSITRFTDRTKASHSRYDVMVAWTVRQGSNLNDKSYNVFYSIDDHGKNGVEGETIVQDPETNLYVAADLTNYDYLQLFEALEFFGLSHTAERADNARADI